MILEPHNILCDTDVTALVAETDPCFGLICLELDDLPGLSQMQEI